MVRSLSLLCALFLGSGCVVIPLGDLLRGPPMVEQVLQPGAGRFSREKIAVIEVDGVIEGGDSGGGFLYSSENTVSEVKSRLQRARLDPEVRGLLLRISSPGGEVTACDVIHHEILEFRRTTGIPVLAVIVDEGASGGYYIACAADAIYAHPTALVGSIGVLLQTFNVAGLFEKIGVSAPAIKSSEKKDLLSPFKPKSSEETAVLQKVVDDLYARFVEVVGTRPGQKLGREEVRALADGRVFSATEAKRLGLVDQIGYLQDAVEELKRLGRFDRAPEIIRYGRGGGGGANLYSIAGGGAAPAARGGGSLELSLRAPVLPRARLLYLWAP